MKRFLSFMVGLTTCLLSLVTQTSCNRIGADEFPSYFDSTDSVEIAKIAQDVYNHTVSPVFEYPSDVMEFHERVTYNETCFNEFKCLPEQTVCDIAKVLLQDYPTITIPDIVEEWRRHKNIYNVLNETPLKDRTEHIESEAPSPKDSAIVEFVELEKFKKEGKNE